MCVVIGLQSTGEANTDSERAQCGDEFNDFVSVRSGPGGQGSAFHDSAHGQNISGNRPAQT